jgi:hypothetical protein
MMRITRAEGALLSFAPLKLSDVAQRRRANRAQQPRLGGWPVAEGTPLAGRSRIGTGPAEPGAEGVE